MARSSPTAKAKARLYRQSPEGRMARHFYNMKPEVRMHKAVREAMKQGKSPKAINFGQMPKAYTPRVH